MLLLIVHGLPEKTYLFLHGTALGHNCCLKSMLPVDGLLLFQPLFLECAIWHGGGMGLGKLHKAGDFRSDTCTVWKMFVISWPIKWLNEVTGTSGSEYSLPSA